MEKDDEVTLSAFGASLPIEVVYGGGDINSDTHEKIIIVFIENKLFIFFSNLFQFVQVDYECVRLKLD